MSLLTPAEVQAYGVGLALSTSDLQTVIDQEEAEIVRRFGSAAGARTETVRGGASSIFLKRAISSVSAVSEYYYLGDTATALASTDYYVWGDEGRIERILTAGKWGALISVTYTPVDDTLLRKSVLLDLIRIATEQPTSGESVSGLSFSIGASGGDTAGYIDQRAAAYARLGWYDR